MSDIDLQEDIIQAHRFFIVKGRAAVVPGLSDRLLSIT